MILKKLMAEHTTPQTHAETHTHRNRMRIKELLFVFKSQIETQKNLINTNIH